MNCKCSCLADQQVVREEPTSEITFVYTEKQEREVLQWCETDNIMIHSELTNRKKSVAWKDKVPQK